MYYGKTHRKDETGTRYHPYFGICGAQVPDDQDFRLIDTGDIEFNLQEYGKDATDRIDCKRCLKSMEVAR